ncbi:MAG: hypothetical protein A2X68_05805 [Ignavibacteria bacterium GWC2_56_12]|nr:MAG: hypothetical protein A2X68_05805 [Ignavibacteria bacterium GWC2_56_12]
MMNESVASISWDRSDPPKRMLAMRFHAVGDAAVTLPYLACLRRMYPLSTIDVLTANGARKLFEDLPWVSNVFVIDTGRGPLARAVDAFAQGLEARWRRYDLIFDLQRNWTSRLVRRIARPAAFTEFERFVPLHAATRVERSLRRAGVGPIAPDHVFSLSPEVEREAHALLCAHGWDGHRALFVLNPAGLWVTRQWPEENYIAVAKEIVRILDGTIVFLGTDRVSGRARRIEADLPGWTMDLSGKTSLPVALAVLRACTAMVTEDSGLMHMGWAVGLPIVALFGSSRHDMSSPTGLASVILHSGDLECGSCMSPTCRFGDVHCLSRRTPKEVMSALDALMSERPGKPRRDLNRSATV